MSKFIQALVIVILTGLAAQVVLAAVTPLIPYAVIFGLVVIAVAAFVGKRRRRW